MIITCKYCDDSPHSVENHLLHMTNKHFFSCDAATQYRCPVCLIELRKKAYGRHFNKAHMQNTTSSNNFTTESDSTLADENEQFDNATSQCEVFEDAELDNDVFCDAEDLPQNQDISFCQQNLDGIMDRDGDGAFQAQIDNLYNECDTFYEDLVSRKAVSNKLAAGIYAQHLQIIVAVCHVFQSSVDPIVFQTILDEVQSKNNDRKSNYLIEKRLQSTCNYVAPKSLAVGYRNETTREGKSISRANNLALVPIEETLNAVFSNPAVADTLEFTSDHLNASTVHPLAAGRSMDIYNEIGGDSILLQFYIDGYGSSNPLGYAASTNKVLACYYRILNLPNWVQTMDTMFLCFLVLENDIKSIGLQEVLRLAIVNQLKRLNQICVTVRGKLMTLPVAVHSFIGDSLGVHEFSGFVCHFRGVSSCRFCLLPYNDVINTSKLDFTKLKSRQWYDAVMQLDPSEWHKFGIKYECVLNEIAFFHIMDSQCVDVMHDLLEGHLRYLMADVAKFVISQGYTLDGLNNAIHTFPFDGTMRDSRPNAIFAEDLRKGQIQHTTASKMLNLAVMLPLILYKANRNIDTQNATWKLYMAFLDVLDMVLAPKVPELFINVLEKRVSTYLQMFITSGGHMTIKPHYMLHYPAVIRRHGPLVYHWCMRFEGFHKQFKQYARVNFNSQDLAMTFARKHQSGLVANQRTFASPEFVKNQHIKTAERLYKKGMAVSFDYCNASNLPKFGSIVEMDVNTGTLTLRVMKTVGFSRRCHAFEVNTTQDCVKIQTANLISHQSYPIYFDKFVCVVGQLWK